MKEQYQALSDNSIKIAISYDNKAINAESEDGNNKAGDYTALAKHHRNESKKYLEAMEALK